MRRDGGENKNTIRMYILPRLLGFFLLFYRVLLISFVPLPLLYFADSPVELVKIRFSIVTSCHV